MTVVDLGSWLAGSGSAPVSILVLVDDGRRRRSGRCRPPPDIGFQSLFLWMTVVDSDENLRLREELKRFNPCSCG